MNCDCGAADCAYCNFRQGVDEPPKSETFKPSVRRQVVYAGGDCFYLLCDPKDDVREGDIVHWTSPKRVRFTFCVGKQVEPGRWQIHEFC